MTKKSGRPEGSGGGRHAATILRKMNTTALEKIAAQYESDPSLLTPLQVMLDIMHNSADEKLKLDASRCAAQYMHSKIPDEVDLADLEESTEPQKQLTLTEITDLLISKLASTVGLSPDQLRAAINTASMEKNNNENTRRSLSGISSEDGTAQS